ncbi:MAG: hypothetical protein AB1633_10145, partial [Elusimicrobiota bacterium]
MVKSQIPHKLISTKKELHGWYPGKRECTSERLLINPYNGCSVGCFFCYARALPGHFTEFHKTGVITVAKDFDRTIIKQLSSINVASCGYLSPVTDPFQPINSDYKLSEKIIKEFVKRNIPVEFITKCRVPDEAVELISGHPHCFAQASILTTDEGLRKILSPGGASTKELFADLLKISKKGIFTVCRIDPILPYLTDSEENLKGLINCAVDSGVRHIIASIMDIPVKISGWVFNFVRKYFGAEIYIKYKKLYTENIGYINAELTYRKNIFGYLRDLCDSKKITFALCMEYEKYRDGSDSFVRGLNRSFMTSKNCEGIDIPVYIRKGEKFVPAIDCAGNCLNCDSAACGIPELAMKKSQKTSFKLSDYRRW